MMASDDEYEEACFRVFHPPYVSHGSHGEAYVPLYDESPARGEFEIR